MQIILKDLNEMFEDLIFYLNFLILRISIFILTSFKHIFLEVSTLNLMEIKIFLIIFFIVKTN